VYNEEQIDGFYEKTDEGFDHIKATRFSKGSAVCGVPWSKRIISRLGNLVAKWLFKPPIADYTSGFRAVRLKLYERIVLCESGFAVIMAELSQAVQFTDSFREVPYVPTSRSAEHRPSALYFLRLISPFPSTSFSVFCKKYGARMSMCSRLSAPRADAAGSC